MNTPCDSTPSCQLSCTPEDHCIQCLYQSGGHICAICYCYVADDHYPLDCGHVFHETCYSHWTGRTCPCCRSKHLTVEDVEWDRFCNLMVDYEQQRTQGVSLEVIGRLLEDYERHQGVPMTMTGMNFFSNNEINEQDRLFDVQEQQSLIYDWKRKNLPQLEDYLEENQPCEEEEQGCIGQCLV